MRHSDVLTRGLCQELYLLLQEKTFKTHCLFLPDMNKEQIVPTSGGWPAYDAREERGEERRSGLFGETVDPQN